MATSDNFQVETTISATVSDNETPTTMTTLPNTSDDGAQHRASGETTVMTLMTQRMEREEEEEEVEDNKENRIQDMTQQESIEITEREVKSTPLSIIRLPILKREDSYTETIVASMETDEAEPLTKTSEGNEDKENIKKETKSKPLAFVKVPKLKREKSNSELTERKKKRVKFSPNDDDDNVMVDTRVFEPIVVSSCGATEDYADSDISCKIKKLLKRRSKKKKSTIETQTEDEKKRENEDKERLLLKDEAPSSTPSSSDDQNRIGDSKLDNNDDNDMCIHDANSPEEKDALNVSASTSYNLPHTQDGASCDVLQEARVPGVVQCPVNQKKKKPQLKSMKRKMKFLPHLRKRVMILLSSPTEILPAQIMMLMPTDLLKKLCYKKNRSWK